MGIVLANVRHGYIDYLDSCKGNPRELNHAWRVIQANKGAKKVYEFPTALQACKNTTICGGWAIFNIYALSRCFSANEIIEFFFPDARNKPAIKRDELISHLIPALFPVVKTRPEKLLIDKSFLR